MANELVAIDISHYQPTPDWPKVKADGVVGVILKCTEGTTYVDDTFADRYRAALEAGLAVSSYHFMRPGSMITQMNHYLNTLEPRDGERVCLDHEDAGVSLADLEAAVEYLLSDSRNLQIAIYSGHVIKEQLGSKKSDVLAKNTSLWLAQYSSSPSWPTGTWPTWSLWQYTDKADVAGIDGYVDGNRFNGSPENCVEWFGPAGAEPVPEPEPEPEPEPAEVVITTTGSVRVIVNGQVVTYE